jgi:hypothetical protein
MPVNVDYTALHIQYVIFFRQKFFFPPLTPIPSIIHNCVHNLVEQLIK